MKFEAEGRAWPGGGASGRADVWGCYESDTLKVGGASQGGYQNRVSALWLPLVVIYKFFLYDQ